MRNEESEALLYASAYENRSARTRTQESDATSWVIILLCLVCTGVNLWAYTSAYKPRIAHYQDLALLRRPNQFASLERVDSPPSHSPRILLYPNLLALVNKAEPHRIYSDDPVRIMAQHGLTPPEDREFKVSKQYSSIVEFRSIDYKMERCELVLDPSHDGSASHPHSNYNARLGPGQNLVNIWRLSTRHSLDSRKLSWHTRPSRMEKIATISVRYGTSWSYNFTCPADTLHSFEFSAASGDTLVEWTQDHRQPVPGVVIYQHSSLRW
ncbi:hypothetical protein K474DRAFT_923194 [Panus rudis PR-1116 ss-1]|nr:hypothetical protein K474DRAFT_923194 [Panus rudis PR-1116 ss-1]